MIEIDSKFVKAPAFLPIYFYNEEKEYKIYIMFLYPRKGVSFSYDYKFLQCLQKIFELYTYYCYNLFDNSLFSILFAH